MRYFKASDVQFPEELRYLQQLEDRVAALNGQVNAEPNIGKIPSLAEDFHAWVSDQIPMMTGAIDKNINLGGTPAENLAVDFGTFAEDAGAVAATIQPDSPLATQTDPQSKAALNDQKNNLKLVIANVKSAIVKAIVALGGVEPDAEEVLPETPAPDESDASGSKSYVYTRKMANYKYKPGDRVIVKTLGRKGIGKAGKVLSLKRINGTGKSIYTVKLDSEDKPVTCGVNDLKLSNG